METKFLITCLIVSVDRTVEIPKRLPNKDASVLLPVPEVPAKRTRIFLLDSKCNVKIKKNLSYKQGQKQYKNPSNILVWSICTSQDVYLKRI